MPSRTIPTRPWRCSPTSPAPPTRSSASSLAASPLSSSSTSPDAARRRLVAWGRCARSGTAPMAATSMSTPASTRWWRRPSASERSIPTTCGSALDEAGHRDLSAGRPERLDGWQAARHRSGRGVGGGVAGARRLLGAVVRQGRHRGEVTGHPEVERVGGRLRARPARLRHDRHRRRTAGRRRATVTVAAPAAR